MTRNVATLDPGVEGALVIHRGGHALLVARWWPRGPADDNRMWSASVAVMDAGHQSNHGLTGPGGIGEQLARWVRPFAYHGFPQGLALGGELPYVGQDKQGAIRLAVFAGALIGPLEPLAVRGRVRWATPSEWRGVALRKRWWSQQARAAGMAASRRVAERDGIPFMPKREAAKREAALCVPPRLAGLTELAERAGGGHEHVYDAGGVGLWRGSLSW